MNIPISELGEINWKNPDVNKLFEILSKQFDKMDQKMKRLERENQKLVAENQKVITENQKVITENNKMRAHIDELTKTIEELKKKKNRSKNARSYNTREFKGYPHVQKPRTTPKYAQQDHPTVSRTLDSRFCPKCGNSLAESSHSYPRCGETIVDGRWTKVNMTILGRYCKKCRVVQYAQPDDFMTKEHFGIDIMAQVSAMRHLTISYGKIQKMFQMFYGRDIAMSTLEDLDYRVSIHMEQLYYGLLEELVTARIVSGDETGWYLNGKLCWTWAFLSDTCTIYHISHSRSKLVSETLLKDFEGILLGDSHPGWSVAEILQKCLLHYFRDMYRTLDKDDNKEFKAFFGELYKILKSAMKLGKKYGSVKDIPKRSVQRLQNRIDALATDTYDNADCNRYAKRLKREGKSLLTFLRHEGVPYHNNASEQAMRTFAIMRKIFYGSRSERGLRTTEIRETMFATCEKRGINPYQFIMDYLGGKTGKIPAPKEIMAVPVAA